MKNKIIGNLGENIVKRYLEEMNYQILKTNFACKQGEIDIIGLDKKELVFIEVKTRGNQKFGHGIEAVDVRKQKHLKNAAQYFIYKYHLERSSIRFDVIEVYLCAKKYYLNHIKNVLW